MLMKTACVWCKRPIFRYVNDINFVCDECSERENMENIKITVEVNGKQVPLETISTETFEAIKALEKPKEIPVARVGNFNGQPNERRLFLKINEDLRRKIIEFHAETVTIDLNTGNAVNWNFNVPNFNDYYENVQPL